VHAIDGARQALEQARAVRDEWVRVADPACWSWPPAKLPRGADPLEFLIEWHANRCGLCGRIEERPGRRLLKDHDHSTGWVRGLLCGSCNQSEGKDRLGMFKRTGENIYSRYRSRPPTEILGLRIAHPSWKPPPPPPSKSQLEAQLAAAKRKEREAARSRERAEREERARLEALDALAFRRDVRSRVIETLTPDELASALRLMARSIEQEVAS
jgi:hypothetical protein